MATEIFFISMSKINSLNLKASKTVIMIIKEKPILKYGIGRGNIFSNAAIKEDRKAKNIISYILLFPLWNLISSKKVIIKPPN